MNVICPICRHEGRCDTYSDGICHRLDEATATHVETLYRLRTPHFPQVRDYNVLPFSLRKANHEWRMRCADVEFVQRYLKPASRVLEIGPWNGWLSHHIARTGHHLTSIAYSDDGDQGLGAKRHYDVDWHTIQMDVTDLSAMTMDFDAIIMNHGLHLFPQPIDYVHRVMDMLAPDGVLLLLGLTFYRDPSLRQAHIKAAENDCQRRFGVPYLLKPAKGYMNFNDRARLKSLGIHLRGYPTMWRANLKARFIATAPHFMQGRYDS